MSPKAKAVLKKCNRKKENDSSVVAVVVVSVVVVFERSHTSSPTQMTQQQ